MRDPIECLQFKYDQMLTEYERTLNVITGNHQNVFEEFEEEKRKNLATIYAQMVEYKSAIEFLKLTKNNYFSNK